MLSVFLTCTHTHTHPYWKCHFLSPLPEKLAKKSTESPSEAHSPILPQFSPRFHPLSRALGHFGPSHAGWPRHAAAAGLGPAGPGGRPSGQPQGERLAGRWVGPVPGSGDGDMDQRGQMSCRSFGKSYGNWQDPVVSWFFIFCWRELGQKPGGNLALWAQSNFHHCYYPDVRALKSLR